MFGKIVLILGIIGILLGGGVLLVSLLLPVLTDGRTSWEEAMFGIIPGAVVLLGAFVVALSLHQFHYTFDPYSWADQNFQSVESRNAWNKRKILYRELILVSLCGAVVFGGITLFCFKRGRQKNN